MSACELAELEPRGAFELAVEMRFTEYELERLATGLLTVNRRTAAFACLADASTLGSVRARLEAGQTTDELAGLFLDAARIVAGRRQAILEDATT